MQIADQHYDDDEYLISEWRYLRKWGTPKETAARQLGISVRTLERIMAKEREATVDRR